MAHGLAISGSHLRRLGHHAQSLQRKLANASKKTEHALDCVIDTLLTVGTSTALGFTHGILGPTEVVGIPLELVGGSTAFGLAIFGVGGKHADKLRSIGNGLLSPYSYNMLKGVGMKLKAERSGKGSGKAGDAAAAAVTGRLPTQALTPEERRVIHEPVAAQQP